MSWSPTDCHAHTTHSDGSLTPAELEAHVRNLGVRPAVADHISRDTMTSVDSVDAIRSYLDDLARHDVLRGGEFCWQDSLWREVPDDLARRFTHRLGSLHGVFLPDGSVVHAFRAFPAELTADAYMDALVENLEQLAREMPVDILAHPTLTPVLMRERPLEELWTESREERAVEALRAAGIAFEVSNRYRPHERLVRRAVAHGVRLALGSDGHSREQVGDVAEPLAMARAAGVRDADLYDPARHGSRTGAWEERGASS